jgi:hypothetical protein
LGVIKRKLVGEAVGGRKGGRKEGREENGNNKKKILLLFFYLVACGHVHGLLECLFEWLVIFKIIFYLKIY